MDTKMECSFSLIYVSRKRHFFHSSTMINKSKNYVLHDTIARIKEHNAKEGVTFTLGHNAFSAMTEQEFAAHMNLHPVDDATKVKMSLEDTLSTTAEQRRRLTLQDVAPLQLPDYINWVQMGAVTPIKNQGSCGSCWAFSTTGALEGAKFVKTGELVALSEQNLLDCDHLDLGCNGGLMDNAFKFDEKSGGLCSEEDYPYQAVVGDECKTDCTDVPGSIVKTFVDVPPGDEKALLSAIAMQPISIAIEASQFVFQFYKNGVITDDKCGSAGSIDHGVLAVGYGTDLDTQHPYFLVKNSWGDTWGDEGFVKIGRKSKNKFGICSILKMASFPVVEA
jgi:C1A family cysteine protease